MAVTFCDCESGKSNLGVLGCTPAFRTVKKHIFLDMLDSSGVANSIKLTDLVNGVLPDTFIVGKINEADKSKRWFITPDNYEDVTPSRTDPKTQEFKSGNIARIEDGVRQFEGFLKGQDSTLASKIASNGCGKTSAFEIDTNGAIRGILSKDGLELFPMLLNNGSLVSQPLDEDEGTTVPMIKLNFQYNALVDESRMMMLKGVDIESNLLNINGLLDGVITVLAAPAITATTVSITLEYLCFGTFGQARDIQGQDVVGNWTLLDGVTPVAISTVVDPNTDGSQYDLVFASTPATTLTLQYTAIPSISTSQGFDIPDVTFITP